MNTTDAAAPHAATHRAHCLVCQSNRFEPFLDECRDLYVLKPFIVNYHQCTACGLVQQSPVPQSVAAFYEAYPVHRPQSAAYSWFRRTLMSSVYRPPQSWAPGAKLLDYGCGDGWYLDWCKEQGLQAVGFEPDAEHAAKVAARLGLPVFSDPDQLLDKYAAFFDVITLHFVVEHLTDLRSVFFRLSRLLKPGGLVRFVVPNIDSWEFKLFRHRWHSLDAPRHISFPARTHAERLGESCGLVCIGEESVAFPNGFGGSVPTALLGRFSAPIFLATLPLSVPVTRLFPSGNKAFVLQRPVNPTSFVGTPAQ